MLSDRKISVIYCQEYFSEPQEASHKVRHGKIVLVDKALLKYQPQLVALSDVFSLLNIGIDHNQKIKLIHE